MIMNTPTTLVALPEKTIALLLALRHSPDDPLAEVVVRLAAPQNDKPRYTDPSDNITKSDASKTGRYRLQIIGENFFAETLGEVLAIALNFFADLDDGLLERVEKMGGRTRRHVAQNRHSIHPGRPDLNRKATKQFRPGWWVGTNYSRPDTRRILKDICGAAGLKYGLDVKLV